ncbi:MAG: ABC transporter ATP-binding protein [Candidatus Deferrimicrobium sp.]|nr:ABC transporter ATP-binding protein [Candidatus Deferrimicrobium sp.]
MLDVSALNAWYHKAMVLTDVNVHVREGTFVAIVGPNGAGKTTLLRSIANLHEKKSGRIELGGVDITREPTHSIVRKNVAYVPDYRGILRTLTVKENLLLVRDRYGKAFEFQEAVDDILERFPHLKGRYNQLASLMSGGEQQMLAIARALLLKPKVLLIDEPSIGLAPLLVKEIFLHLAGLIRQGMSVLMVEQNIVRSLEASDYCYVIEKGRVVLEGESRLLSARDDLQEKYFGRTAE